MSQGSDDGHTLVGANSKRGLAASENSVITIFPMGRDDDLEAGETRYLLRYLDSISRYLSK